MSASSLIGQTVSSTTSNYEVKQILGSGSFGTVALCRKEPADEQVALKIIKKKSFIEKSIKEVAILNFMKGRGSEKFHIVEWRTAFLANDSLFLEFERLDRSLMELIEEFELPLWSCRPIIHQLVEALNFLKFVGVVHADLKPENVMLVDHVRQPLKVKLIDFGLAVRDPERHTGSIFGTLTFISPEMLLGAPFDYAIDTWALGCMGVEIMTGNSLFHGDDHVDMMRRIVSVIGKPPDSLISSGLYTNKHFRVAFYNDLTWTWSLKSGATWSDPDDPESITSLTDLLNVPVKIFPGDALAVKHDRMMYVDLLTRMLNVDPLKRITPAEILQHPFLTLNHLDRCPSGYAKLSRDLMKICPGWTSSHQTWVQHSKPPPKKCSLDREDKPQCATSWTPKNNMAKITDLYSSTQQVRSPLSSQDQQMKRKRNRNKNRRRRRNRNRNRQEAEPETHLSPAQTTAAD